MLDILSAVLSRSGADRREQVAEEGGPLSGRGNRNGLLVHGGRSAPFRLVALAQQGLMGECDMRLPVGAQVDISIDGGAPVTAVLRWVRDNRFGAQLGSPLSRGSGPIAARRKVRPPRFRVDLQGTARYGAVAIPVRLRNISSQGCLIEAALLPRLGHRIEIELPDLLPLRGRVRWSHKGRAGLLLEVPLSEDQLLHLIPPRPTPTSLGGYESSLEIAAARLSSSACTEHIAAPVQ